MEVPRTAAGAGALRTRKAGGRKEWTLSEPLEERIAALAREDAARGVYMGERFLALRREEAAKAGPDRAALLAELTPGSAGEREVLEKIREGDERWLRLWFGRNIRLERQGGTGFGSALHLYDGNGEEVLSYTAGAGWHQKETKAESRAHGAMKAAYYDAWKAAKEQTGPGGLDTRA